MDSTTTVSPGRIKAKNILLTERDFEILLSLYENVVMTFSQVACRHFAINKKPTVMNRLARLESSGLIRRERIPKMRLGLDDHAIGVVFQITKLGIATLTAKFPEREFKREPIRIHPYTLHHDLILVDVMARLKEMWPEAKIINGKHLFHSGSKAKGLEPDLVLRMPGTSHQIAVELELNDKSETRYRELVLRYRMAKEFDKIIYLVSRPFIQGLMTKVILNRTPYKDEMPDTGKFYFANTFEFLKTPALTPITNGKTNLLTIGA